MALTAAERAASHRARQQDKLARYSRMEAALTEIIGLTGSFQGPAMSTIRRLANRALSEGLEP